VPYWLGRVCCKTDFLKTLGIAPHSHGGQHYHLGVSQKFVRLDGATNFLSVHVRHRVAAVELDGVLHHQRRGQNCQSNESKGDPIDHLEVMHKLFIIYFWHDSGLDALG